MLVETLEACEQLIDNLDQINVTLESIAKALFKSWFVDFDGVPPDEMTESELGMIPTGWRVDQLGALCENIRDQARPNELPPATPYIGLEHMPRKSIALTDWGTSDGLASGKFWYQRNDVLFGKLRPYFHKVGVPSHKGICSTDILVIRAKADLWAGFVMVQLSSDAVIAHATQVSNGAKMPRANWQDLATYKVAIPPAELAAKFNSIVGPMVQRIHENVDLVRTLSELRDTLLPRIISGKLRIKP